MDKRTDPLPSIASALLNSADIQAYQAALGLISARHFDTARLKAASYKILCEGTVYYSDEANRRQVQKIDRGAPFTIPRNGLVFLEPDAAFNLPDFIAARFNLTIDLVHRGLLLGTGPLVDPGFTGKLLIPLHNLTDSSVELKSSDGLIWVEFTKLPTIGTASHSGRTFDFKESFAGGRAHSNVLSYFEKTGGVPVRSTLFDHAKRWETNVAELQQSQEKAKSQEERLRSLIGFGVLGGAIALVSLFAAVWQTYSSAISIVQQAQQSLESSNKVLTKAIESNRVALCDVIARIDNLERYGKSGGSNTGSSSQPYKPDLAVTRESLDLECAGRR